MADRKTAFVHLKHDPLVLRVEKRVEAELGESRYQTEAEIPLKRGRNEVDAEHWARWCRDNENSPLLKNKLLHEEKPEGKTDGDAEENNR